MTVFGPDDPRAIRRHVGKGDTMCWCGQVHFKKPEKLPLFDSGNPSLADELAETFGDRKITHIKRGPYLHIEVEAKTFAPDDATDMLDYLSKAMARAMKEICGDEVEIKINKVRNAVTYPVTEP